VIKCTVALGFILTLPYPNSVVSVIDCYWCIV